LRVARPFVETIDPPAGGAGFPSAAFESNQVHSLADWATVSGGNRNHVEGSCDYGFIGGGQFNRMRGDANWSAISGELGNFIGTNSNVSAIGGGVSNTVQRFAGLAAIVGGQNNRIFNGATGAAIGGGVDNSIFGGLATIADGPDNSVSLNARFASISGGASNWIGEDAAAAHIGGGSGNEIDFAARRAFVGGGEANLILSRASHATVSGGLSNQIGLGASLATIAGGWENEITTGADTATISGGRQNRILAGYGSIGGGQLNEITGYNSTVAGGLHNRSSGPGATIPGGQNNQANGYCSFAAGVQATAQHEGAFVWADAYTADPVGTEFASTAPRQFLIRVAGGVGIGHNAPNAPLHVVGGPDANLAGGGTLVLGAVSGLNMAIDGNEIQARNNSAASPLFLNAGGGNVSIGTATANARLRVVNATCDGEVWSNSSDRHLKEGFEPVDAKSVLEMVAALPLSRWNYTNAPGNRHIGPMAQDFQAAFGVGSDDKHIATVDADGVALAAIQALHALVKAQAADLNALKQELAELRLAVKAGQ